MPAYRPLVRPHALLAIAVTDVLLTAAAATAQPFASGDMNAVATNEHYLAAGNVTFSAPPNSNNIQTTPYHIPGGAPWSFDVSGSATSFSPTQATGFQVKLTGKHEGIHAGEQVNELREITTSPKNIWAAPGVAQRPTSAQVSAWGAQLHAGDDPGHGDFYSIDAKLKSYGYNNNPFFNADQMLADPVLVQASHRKIRLTDLLMYPSLSAPRAGATRQNTMSNPGGAPSVSFDALTHKLSFTTGTIDVLDRGSGAGGTIDAEYSNDSLRAGGTISISDLTYEGPTSDGRHRFGGGTVTVSDPNGSASMSASFDEFLIGDTTRTIQLDSYALLNDGEASQDMLSESDPAPSPWMRSFVSEVVDPTVGALPDMPERWIDLSFVTDTNLVDLTNGFTSNAMGVPADVYVGGGQSGGASVPEPSSVGAVIVATAAVLARRRRR